MRINKAPTLVAIICLIVVGLGTGAFYWFGYRPSTIKKTCSKNSIDQYNNVIQSISDKWNNKILQDTGYSWDEIFNCRESYSSTDALLNKNKPGFDQAKADRCNLVLYSDRKDTTYWNQYPVNIAGLYDASRNTEIKSVIKDRDQAVDRNYKECLRSKG